MLQNAFQFNSWLEFPAIFSGYPHTFGGNRNRWRFYGDGIRSAVGVDILLKDKRSVSDGRGMERMVRGNREKLVSWLSSWTPGLN